MPTADTPATGVILFTSDSSINARIGARIGTLIIKNAAAFRTVADGSIVDVQTIVGGTGDFAGASGAMTTVPERAVNGDDVDASRWPISSAAPRMSPLGTPSTVKMLSSRTGYARGAIASACC